MSFINKKSAKKLTRGIASLSMLFMAAAASAAPVDDISDIPMKKAKDHKTLLLYSQNPEKLGDGRVRFQLNISDVNAFDYLRTNFIAVVQPNKDVTINTLCPYFELSAREYELAKPHDNEKQIITVTTKASVSEIELAAEKGCIVTDWPPYSQIEKLHP
jgi:hypothetical protein